MRTAGRCMGSYFSGSSPFTLSLRTPTSFSHPSAPTYMLAALQVMDVHEVISAPMHGNLPLPVVKCPLNIYLPSKGKMETSYFSSMNAPPPSWLYSFKPITVPGFFFYHPTHLAAPMLPPEDSGHYIVLSIVSVHCHLVPGPLSAPLRPRQYQRP